MLSRIGLDTGLKRSVLLLALVLLGCAKQAEGERCDRANDNNDCESGLECVSLLTLTGAAEGAVCCPRSNPSEPICRRRGIDLSGDDEEPPADAGADAGTDASAP